MLILLCAASLCFFFFNDTATTEIYTLSLHDALPISRLVGGPRRPARCGHAAGRHQDPSGNRHGGSLRQGLRHCRYGDRSEEHTSELQSRLHLVCRLLLEKKKTGSHSVWPTTRMGQG